MYDRILVPLDGSEASKAALVFVEQLTSKSIRLLQVEQHESMPISPLMMGIYVDWEDPNPEQPRDELESMADRLRNQGWTVEVEIRSGDAAEEIIASAEDADLVVMTTHGRGAAGRLIFGSTADRVARHGTTPTLLLRVGADPIESVALRRVVVPLDGSELAEQALPEAEKLARILKMPIHLARAVGADEVMATVRAELAATKPELSQEADVYERARQKPEREAAEYLATHATALQEAGLTAEIEILKGTPAFALLWMIRSDDVIVMTTHGLGGYQRWMIGSVAEKLVREAAAPVLLVRDTRNTDRKSATEESRSNV